MSSPRAFAASPLVSPRAGGVAYNERRMFNFGNFVGTVGADGIVLPTGDTSMVVYLFTI